jgi:hypothetical protein
MTAHRAALALTSRSRPCGSPPPVVTPTPPRDLIVLARIRRLLGAAVVTASGTAWI